LKSPDVTDHPIPYEKVKGILSTKGLTCARAGNTGREIINKTFTSATNLILFITTSF
jgi:hypothetical protein